MLTHSDRAASAFEVRSSVELKDSVCLACEYIINMQDEAGKEKRCWISPETLCDVLKHHLLSICFDKSKDQYQ